MRTKVSPDTLLHLVSAGVAQESEVPLTLGVDDFAFVAVSDASHHHYEEALECY